MSIAKIMTTKLITVSALASVGEMHELLQSKPIHHLLVVSEGHLIGVVSDRDVLKNLSPFVGTKAEDAKDRFTRDRKAQQIMKKDPLTINVSAGIREAARVMLDNGVSLLPVVDEEDMLIGVLSWKDVLRFIID